MLGVPPPPPPSPNKFGIGLHDTGDALQWDRAADLVGSDGWVLFICWGIDMQTNVALQNCRDAVREISNRGQNVIVRLSPPDDNRHIRDQADQGTNHLHYTQLAQRYRQVVADLLAAMGGSTKKLVAQIGNELNLCYEWASNEEIDAATMVAEVAGFHRDVGDALVNISDSRLIVTNAPMAPGGVLRCHPDGTGDPGYISSEFIGAMAASVPGLFSSGRFDAFASHPYPSSSPGLGNPNVPWDQAALGLHDYEGELMSTGNANLPVFITETGWTTRARAQDGCANGSTVWQENEVADWTVRAFNSTDQANRGWLWDNRIVAITPFILGPDYCWDGFAFLNSDGSERSRFNSLRNERCLRTTGAVCGPAAFTVNQGKSLSFSANVPPGQAYATFATLFSSDVVMSLRSPSPSGRVIDRSTIAPDVVHTVGPTSETYVIANPEPGAWEVSLYGADVTPEGEPVEFSIETLPVDSTPPEITPVISGTPGTNGWYVSDVTVSFNVSDPESGIASSSGCDTVTITQESTGFMLTCTATNGVGLTAQSSVTVKIDKTASVITGERTPAPNATGWNNTDVTVTFSCSDAISGVATVPASPQVITTEGAGQSCSATCTDFAGWTSSATVSDINIDKESPMITITSPVNGGTYILGSAIASNYSCNDQDGLSGVATCSGPVPSGSNFNTSIPGSNNFTVNASDVAGNTASVTNTYNVIYDFVGFLPPIENPPVFNVGKAGRTFPIKWQLKDASGVFISDLNVVVSDPLLYRQINCDSSALQDPLPVDTSGSSGLRYDSTANQYIFNWQTSSSFVNNCYELLLDLNDGTQKTARFRFTR